MTTAQKLALLIAPALAGYACAPRNVEVNSQPAAQGATVRYTGQVAITGSQGNTLTTISVEGRGAIGIVGPLQQEIRNLSGAKVLVEGPPGTGYPGESVNVQRYEVLEVNGQMPFVGVLARTSNGYVLEQEGSSLTLDAVTPALSNNVGAKVWITGNRAGNRVSIQSFGIIRPR